MINANLAYHTSNTNFENKYKPEITFIEDKIWEIVKDGFRSVTIKATSHWVSENDKQTDRLITYFKEQGFKIKIIEIGVGNMSKWSKNCDGIEISWELN